MLEERDIERLAAVLITRVELQETVANLATKDDINQLLNAIDAYAHKADTFFQEMVMLSHKVDRHERWILQLAEKLGMTLKV